MISPDVIPLEIGLPLAGLLWLVLMWQVWGDKIVGHFQDHFAEKRHQRRLKRMNERRRQLEQEKVIQ